MENLESVSQTEWWGSKPHEVSEDHLSKSGNILVIKLHVLMKISRIYDVNNQTLHHFIQEFIQVINPLILKYKIISLKIIRDDLYLNEQRLRWLVEGFSSFKFLLAELKKRCIGEIIFRMALNERILMELPCQP
jgi:hypothetical protein